MGHTPLKEFNRLFPRLSKTDQVQVIWTALSHSATLCAVRLGPAKRLPELPRVIRLFHQLSPEEKETIATPYEKELMTPALQSAEQLLNKPQTLLKHKIIAASFILNQKEFQACDILSILNKYGVKTTNLRSTIDGMKENEEIEGVTQKENKNEVYQISHHNLIWRLLAIGSRARDRD